MLPKFSYLPFLLGVMFVGGLIVTPLLFYWLIGLSYLKSLPWSVFLAAVYVASLKRDGRLSWARGVPAILLFVLVSFVYTETNALPSFSAVVAFSLIALYASGQLGVLIVRAISVRGKSGTAESQQEPGHKDQS